VATQAGVVVATRGKPAIIIGASPDRMEVVKLEVPYACTSAKSIVDMGEFAVYASPAGLVSISGNTATLLTKDLLTREQWDAYDPQHLVGGTFDGKYVGGCPNLLSDANAPLWDAGTPYNKGDYVRDLSSTYRLRSLQDNNLNHPIDDTAWWERTPLGFIFDLQTGDWMDVSQAFSASANHLPTDSFYLATYDDDGTGTAYQWNAGTEYRPFTWVSKTFALPKPTNFGAGQLVASTFTGGLMTVECWFDGVLRHSQRVGGDYVADLVYAAGDVVHADGEFYRSRAPNNVGHAPSGLDSWWVPCDPTEPFRLPSGFYTNSVRLVFRFAGGQDPVSFRRFALGGSVDEVKQS
jgi:hypothetical protein